MTAEFGTNSPWEHGSLVFPFLRVKQTCIGSTYHELKHKNAGIPPYKLVEVPKPGDLTMTALHRDEFRRFAISYGLSIPFREGPDVGTLRLEFLN